MTKETIGKLEEAFLFGATDREASLFANIHPDTLYAYCQANPSFSDRKELLKEQVKVRAKQNIANGIHAGEKMLSQWYLERKSKDEFSTRTEATGAGGKDLIPDTSDEVKKLTEQLNALHRGTSIPSNGTTPNAVDTKA